MKSSAPQHAAETPRQHLSSHTEEWLSVTQSRNTAHPKCRIKILSVSQPGSLWGIQLLSVSICSGILSVGFSHENPCRRHPGSALAWHCLGKSMTHGGGCRAILTSSNHGELMWIYQTSGKRDKAGLPRLHRLTPVMMERWFNPFSFRKGSG